MQLSARVAESSAFVPSATSCMVLPTAPFVQMCIFVFEDGIAAFGGMKMWNDAISDLSCRSCMSQCSHRAQVFI